MGAYTRLSRPPITEALIDFRIRTEVEPNLSELEKLCDELKSQFPIKKRNFKFSGGMKIGDGSQIDPEASFSQWLIGFRLETTDGKRVAQLNIDGFTMSWLTPYDTWESLRDYAKPVWEQYRLTVKPEAVIRVAVRYINRIEIDLPMVDFDRFLVAPPIVPKCLPQLVENFVTRTVVALTDQQAHVIVTQGSEAVDQGRRTLPVVIDIDAFKEDSFDVDGDSIWTTLEFLRTVKNDAFFGSLTAQALEKYR